jgi:flagellar biosynthesis protein FlhB
VAKNSGDKTEAPTAKRKREARKEGQIPRSQELTSWGSLLVAVWLAPATFGAVADLLDRLMRRTSDLIAEPDMREAIGMLGDGLRGALLALAPFVLGLMLLGVAGQLAQIGWAPSPKAMKPQLKKLNPVAGFKKTFSVQGLWEGGKAALKVVLLALVSWGPLASVTEQLAGQGAMALDDILVTVGASALSLAQRIALAGLGLAVVDYVLQRRRINKSLKMSKHDIKEEAKQSEGNPQMKGEIRARQLAMSRNRMMAEIPKADVVIVNPTHVAVALRYDPTNGAPRVIAKGAGVVAARIRELAQEHGIPLVQDVPLARTLHKLCDLGDEIPGDLFEAVARVLAFVFALRARKASPRPLPLPVYQPATT